MSDAKKQESGPVEAALREYHAQVVSSTAAAGQSIDRCRKLRDETVVACMTVLGKRSKTAEQVSDMLKDGIIKAELEEEAAWTTHLCNLAVAEARLLAALKK